MRHDPIPSPPSSRQSPRWVAPVIASAIVGVVAIILTVHLLAPEPYAYVFMAVGIGGCLGMGATLMSYIGWPGRLGVTGLGSAIGALTVALGDHSTPTAWVAFAIALTFGAINVGREVASGLN